MKTYKFNNVEDMIALAQDIQSSVYWGMRFTIKEDDDDFDEIPYKTFWDLVEIKVNEGFTAVSISENNEVEFTR